MKGYDDDPEATARAVDPEGWLHTGDLGLMRSDGHIHLTGRAKDLIIRGGENIYPREIEEFLYTNPKVAEVQVVGLPDSDWERSCWLGFAFAPARPRPKLRSASSAGKDRPFQNP